MKTILTAGPEHLHPDLHKIELDAPTPPLEPGQAAITVGCHREIVKADLATWRWVAEWEILENR